MQIDFKILVLIVILAGCRRPASSPATSQENHPAVPAETLYEQEPLSYAVLLALEKKMGSSFSTNDCGDLGKTRLLRRVGEQRRQIECVRAWAKSLPNRQVGARYAQWLDYYEDKAKDALDACEPEKSDNKELIDESERRKDMAAGRLLNIPKPRDCSVTEMDSQ